MVVMFVCLAVAIGILVHIVFFWDTKPTMQVQSLGGTLRAKADSKGMTLYSETGGTFIVNGAYDYPRSQGRAFHSKR